MKFIFEGNLFMNKKQLLLAGVSLVLGAGLISCVSTQKNSDRQVAGLFDSIREIVQKNRENYAEIFGDKARARELKTSDVVKYASSSNISLKEAKLLTDNDAAFEAKLKTIQSAERELRLTYFIYANDDSSSILTQEIIKKARSGVKVKLLVDFITNYKNIDLFKFMVKEGGSNMDIRFYNFPSERIQADARYMTMPCPQGVKPESDSCKNHKLETLKSLTSNEATFFSKLFLAGLYGKNPVALQIALGMGAQIDPASFSSGKKMSEDEQAKLIQFFKMYFQAKVQKDIGARISLMIAMNMYGDDLNPLVNQITGRLPAIDESATDGRQTSHAQEWDHFSDYTHHKLVLADKNNFVLGGRNIEDSYHMKYRVPAKNEDGAVDSEAHAGKYIFMDTDFFGVAKEGQAADMANSFDKTFNFTEMVAPLSKVEQIIPNDLIMNTEALYEAQQKCTALIKNGQLDFIKSDICVEENLKNNLKYQSSTRRIVAFKKDFTDSYNRYRNEYVKKDVKQMSLSASDLQNAEIYYLENTSFNIKNGNAKKLDRKVGARIGAEETFNKNIHKIWYKSLENACYVSQVKKQDVRIVFHSAYLFLPSGLVHKITKMMNGDYGDCSKVYITFLTNSIETTDLNVVNVFARYQLVQMFKHYKALLTEASTFRRWIPKIDYYEYKASSLGAGVSLHTKVSLFGHDIMIGSANADIRSYAMDTNNALFIRNASKFTAEYAKNIDRIISDRNMTQPMDDIFANMSEEGIKLENQYILGAMICRWDKKATNCPAQKGAQINAYDIKSERFNSSRIKDILTTLDKVGADITYKTRSLLNFRGEFDMVETYQHKTAGDIEVQLNDLSNQFDDFYKVL